MSQKSHPVMSVKQSLSNDLLPLHSNCLSAAMEAAPSSTSVGSGGGIRKEKRKKTEKPQMEEVICAAVQWEHLQKIALNFARRKGRKVICLVCTVSSQPKNWLRIFLFPEGCMFQY